MNTFPESRSYRITWVTAWYSLCAGIADFTPAFWLYSFAVSKLRAIFKQRHNEHKIAKSAHNLRFLEVQLHKVQVNAFWYKWLITLQKSGTSLLFYWSFMSTLISQNSISPGYFLLQMTKHGPSFCIFELLVSFEFFFPEGICLFSFLCYVCVHIYCLYELGLSQQQVSNSRLPNQKENLWGHNCNVQERSYFEPRSDPRRRKCHFDTRSFSLLLGSFLSFTRWALATPGLYLYNYKSSRKKNAFFPWVLQSKSWD